MPEIDRTRDVVIFAKGDTMAVAVSPSMAASGWAGGQAVQWFASGKDEFAVELSDGAPQGFMLWGSDEDSDQFTAMTRQFPRYQFGVMGFGGWLMSTRTYETHTLASGRTTPIVYSPQDELLLSLGGKWTTEDEWTVTADARAPNENVAGVVVQAPSAVNNFFLTLQVRL